MNLNMVFRVFILATYRPNIGEIFVRARVERSQRMVLSRGGVLDGHWRGGGGGENRAVT